MMPHRRTTICREGFLYLVMLGMVFTGAILREVNLLLMLAGLMAGPLLLSWRAVVVALRGLEARRSVPNGICAGDLLVGTVCLENTRRRLGSRAVVVEEQMVRETPVSGEKPIRVSVLFPMVPARETREGSYRGRLPQRGRYRLGPLRISTRYPFGLFSRTVSVGPTHCLTVFPKLGRLTQQWARRHRESLAGEHRRERRPGPEGDFYGVREWRAGDIARRVHWRTSARIGKLVVRQFEQPRNRDVAVVLDLFQPRHAQPEHHDSIELAVSFAATLVTDLCRHGESNVLLCVGGAQPSSLGGPASAVVLQEMMECLAVAQGDHHDHLPELLQRGLAQIQSATEIILIGTRPISREDVARLLSASSEGPQRALLRRIRSINASSDELYQYFQAE